MTDLELMKLAYKAREFSISPYSGYSVGAALLCDDGTVYLGCNIETSTFTPTICAERTALFKALSEGKKNFSAIAITGGLHGEVSPFCGPCGVCRQVLSEFCPKKLKLVLGTAENIQTFTLDQFLPYSFGPEDLKK